MKKVELIEKLEKYINQNDISVIVPENYIIEDENALMLDEISLRESLLYFSPEEAHYYLFVVMYEILVSKNVEKIEYIFDFLDNGFHPVELNPYVSFFGTYSKNKTEIVYTWLDIMFNDEDYKVEKYYKDLNRDIFQYWKNKFENCG